MKAVILYMLPALLLLAGCNKDTKEAQARLAKATELFNNNELAAAKTEIDSLRAHYPKELAVLKDGLTLMREIEWKEAERNVVYIDSVLPIRQREAEELAKGFAYEKDTAYNEIGTYVWKPQVLERNIERSYIRCGVNEEGEMYLASVYFGKGSLKHTGITISAGNDLSVSTPAIPYDGGLNYRFENLGMTTEIVTYKSDNGTDAIRFIYDHARDRLKVTYTGGKSYILYMADADKKALVATYNLSVALTDIHQMSITKNKAYHKMDYLRGKNIGE